MYCRRETEWRRKKSEERGRRGKRFKMVEQDEGARLNYFKGRKQRGRERGLEEESGRRAKTEEEGEGGREEGEGIRLYDHHGWRGHGSVKSSVEQDRAVWSSMEQYGTVWNSI